ncbi:7638_t:CDS:2, partial [Gigaspora margarita]
EVKTKNKSLPYLSMVAKQMKGLEFYILVIEGVIRKAAEDAFEDKFKLNDNELKNVYDIFDSFSRSQLSIVKPVVNFYKGCFHHDGIGGCTAKSDHEETKNAAELQLTDLKSSKNNRTNLIDNLYY